MATIENIADDMEMIVSEYYEYVFNSHTNWNQKESYKMVLEIASVWRLDEYLSSIEDVYDAQTYYEYVVYLAKRSLNGD